MNVSSRAVALPAVLALVLTPLVSVASVSAAEAAAKPATKPGWTKNCTELNKKYKHGVGKKAARDKTTGKPVTNFTKSDQIYATAMKYNKGLDRDKDGIACEKR
ncbi:excalibur calcium-binding domain-containing protein [Dermacoccaceae bacterium W4C1]